MNDSPQTSPTSRLKDYKAAAAYLDCSYWTIRKLVADGILRSVSIGRLKKIDQRDLDELIEQQKEKFA